MTEYCAPSQCPAHDHRYDPVRRGKFCVVCDQQVVDDWGEEKKVQGSFLEPVTEADP